MKLAGAEASRFLAKPDPTRAGLLIFGADAMRVALKRQEAIAALVGPGAAGCGKLDTELHALYTVYHPFVGSARVYFEGNPPLPAATALSLVAGEAVSPAGGLLIDISAQAPCAYVLWLEATLNLTSGWGRIAHATTWDHIAFCKG